MFDYDFNYVDKFFREWPTLEVDTTIVSIISIVITFFLSIFFMKFILKIIKSTINFPIKLIKNMNDESLPFFIYLSIVLVVIFIAYVIRTIFNTEGNAGEYYFIQLLLIGIVSTISIWAQIHLFSNDFGIPDRLKITLVISVVFVIGAIAHAVLTLTDQHSTTTTSQVFLISGKVILLAVIANAKSYFSPIAIGIGSIISIYYIINYNEDIDVNIVMISIDWLFSGFPSWVKNTYAIIMSIYLFLTLMIDS